MNDAKDELNAAERESEALPRKTVAALPSPTVLRADILLRGNQIQNAEALTMGLEKSIMAMPG